MPKCGYCGSAIIVGGVRSGTERFCNNKCAQNAYVLQAAKRVPPAVVDRQVEEVFHGNCPKCRGIGPIDVHKVHRVWSALVLTAGPPPHKFVAALAQQKARPGARCFRRCSVGGDFPGGSC